MSLNKRSNRGDNYIALIILAVSVLALAFPAVFTWIPTSSINWLLGVVMFGMGLTLKPTDFKPVIKHPLPVLAGLVAQFTLMPALAWLLCRLFHLSTEVSIGVILVGCCPGGTASNIITYLAKGDTALSVCMTGLSTLVAPIATPFLTLLLAGEMVEVNALVMMLSVVKVVMIPVMLGVVINRLFSSKIEPVLPAMPLFSTVAVAAILGIVLSINAHNILSSGLLILLVVMLHNLGGLALGYGVGLLLGFSKEQRRTLAIEVGMQNSGLASSLATHHFAAYPLAAVPGAIFSVWHNFSGALFAGIARREKVTGQIL